MREIGCAPQRRVSFWLGESISSGPSAEGTDLLGAAVPPGPSGPGLARSRVVGLQGVTGDRRDGRLDLQLAVRHQWAGRSAVAALRLHRPRDRCPQPSAPAGRDAALAPRRPAPQVCAALECSTISTRMPPASFGWMKLTRLLLVPRFGTS